jgi:hypothetical protein
MNITARPRGSERPRAIRYLLRSAVVIAVIGLVAFWTWALLFASKESINRIEDRQWSQRAEQICAAADDSRRQLADYRRVDPSDPASLAERAAAVDRATDVLETMVDQVALQMPSDPKGAEIAPLWVADYRSYLLNRRDHADRLRSGSNPPFRETRVDNLPISERIGAFAVANDMASCSPPFDL